MISWIARKDIKSVALNHSAIRNYSRHAQAGLKRTVWSKGCHAWYNNGQAVTAMYRGKAIEDIRDEDFDIRYENNSDPFSYLGIGELEWERAEDADLAFYLK
ncbi:hypothetical protein VN97_g4794 [Penicillium thymicola]|uniref:Uncharacterized protein n=1 Tax=Penicillium thymicola TaxID=293382 RepID=A0AAI9TJW3_PENTH|nr:hypothetical protein VN97_g4794 [Penicillium thymicola]